MSAAMLSLIPSQGRVTTPAAASPQCATILRHLKFHGGLTSMEAEGVYRIRRLASRVSELRSAGYVIKSIRKVDPTGQRYVRYVLEGNLNA